MSVILPPSIEQTRAIVEIAYAGQVDKAGFSCVDHINRVFDRSMSIARDMQIGSDDVLIVQHASLLHDILEDTHTRPRHLAALGYDKAVIDTVQTLTRDKYWDVPYNKWIEVIIGSGNLPAKIIKLADNEDNADPQRLARLPRAHRESLSRRYDGSIARLRAALRGPAA